MFRTFTSQKERKENGGSAFIELQYCRLPNDLPENVITDYSNITNFALDSLYVYADDAREFCREYGKIFGDIDIYGINYFTQSQMQAFTEKILQNKPTEWEVIAMWMKNADSCNGFCILGL